MPISSGALVGRDADLARLSDAVGLHDATGGVAVLSGDAGIGKSRLLAQLTADATTAGWTTATGHCVGQAGSALAYLPFVELISALEALEPDVVADVLDTHPSLARLLPGRGDELDAAGHSTQANPGLVAESVHALFAALGAARPTLVVLEDVHWADHSSRDLLTLLLTRGFATPVALVASYRADDLHRRHPLHETLAVWDRIPQVEHVALSPLTDTDMGELLAGITGMPTDRYTVEEITRRAEGNPFFAEELAASAAAGHPVSGGLGRVLRARIEQLDETTQRVVRAVALKGGQSLGHELLARVVGLPDEQLEAALAEAVEHHVLESCWPPAYTFRHALLGETAADSLLPGERLRLHRSYAAVLAEHPALAPASELARHAAASGDLGAAVTASRAAAESALSVGGPHEALGHLERALDWLDMDDPDRDEVSLRAADAAMAAGDTLRAVGLLQDRVDHPGPTQRPEARADLLAALADRARLLDIPVDRRALTTEAVSLLGSTPDERRVRVLVAHLQQLVDTRQFAEAVRLSDEATELAEWLGLDRALVEIRTVMSRVIEAQQDLDATEAYLQRVLADVSVDDPIQIRLVYQLASVSHRRGDLVEALARFDEGARIALRLHREWAPWGLESRLVGGLTAYELGDWDGATERLAIELALAPQPGRAIFEAAALHVPAGRGDFVDLSRIKVLREWWPVDGMAAVLTAMPGIDLYGDTGDLPGTLDLAREAITALDRIWGNTDAGVRIAALATAQAATYAPRADAGLRSRAATEVDDFYQRAAHRVDKLVRMARDNAEATRGSIPKGTGSDATGTTRARTQDTTTGAATARLAVAAEPANLADLDLLRPASRETWAWARRLVAERMRFAWLSGADDAPTPAEMVTAWRDSVEAFDALGHVFEAARSRARLAAALHAAGDVAESRAVALVAREVATRLGAVPLLAELDRLSPRTNGNGGASDLTPREVEVLGLVARGLSNGQIGKQLFISTKTVSVHVSNLLAKLGASGRTEAAALARDRNLLP